MKPNKVLRKVVTIIKLITFDVGSHPIVASYSIRHATINIGVLSRSLGTSLFLDLPSLGTRKADHLAFKIRQSLKL